MKIAITADVHLTNEERHRPRANALRDVIKKCKEHNVGALVIAGDLFDKDYSNPRVFEDIVRGEMPIPFDIIIIPGNHDPKLTSSLFSSELPLDVISQPAIRNIDPDLPFFFIPFSAERFIGAELEKFKEQLPPNKFILFSHGDFQDMAKVRNAYETGTYMPLFRKDLNQFSPRKVFLGHIHISNPKGIVNYPGSPCGIDINETGSRSFLLYDTETDQCVQIPIATDFVNRLGKLILIPDGDETAQIRNAARSWLNDWQKDLPGTIKQVIRITVDGYSTERGFVEEKVRQAFEDAKANVEVEKVITDNCSAPNQISVGDMIADLREQIDQVILNKDEGLPDESEILFECLQLIYGDKK